MLLAVVIPVYNERDTLPRLLVRLDATPPPGAPGGALARRLILVDDASTDGSTELVRELTKRGDVLAVYHTRNRGKGAALRSGFAAALADGADLVLIQDGDLEYDPADHAAVVAPIVAGGADAVIGSPILGRARRVQGFWRQLANRAITRLSNVLTRLDLSDVECGYKAFSREVLQKLQIREDRFGVEPEFIARLSHLRLGPDGRRARIVEVPVRYEARGYAEGKKIGWRDGLRAVWCIIRYNLLS